MTTTTEPTILDADLALTLRTAADGTVILAGRPSEDGERHFTPDEARRFGGALLRHSGQGGGFASMFEDDAVYMYGPSRQPWAPTEDTERATLPPVTCTPWCSDGNGHGGVLFAGDQRCISVPVQIPGSLLRPDPEDTSGEPEYVCVYGEGWANDALPPQIHVGQSEASGLELTVDEARQVAAALIAAADVVEGGTR